MRRAEFVKQLEHNGFVLKRHKKHMIYTDGRSRIVVPGGGKREIDYRLSKQLKIDFNKAMEKRGDLLAQTKEEKEDVRTFNPPTVTRVYRPQTTLSSAPPAPEPAPAPAAPAEPTAEKKDVREISYEDAFKIFEPMRAEGVTNREICRQFEEAGYVKKNGKPFQPEDISFWGIKLGGIRRVERRTKARIAADERLKAEAAAAAALAARPVPRPQPVAVPRPQPIFQPQPPVQRASTKISEFLAQIADIATCNLGETTKVSLVKELANKL